MCWLHIALELLCSISSFAGFEKWDVESCEFDIVLSIVLFLYFDCSINLMWIDTQLLLILYGGIHLSVVSHHMINLDVLQNWRWNKAVLERRIVFFFFSCYNYKKACVLWYQVWILIPVQGFQVNLSSALKLSSVRDLFIPTREWSLSICTFSVLTVEKLKGRWFFYMGMP